MAHNLVWPFNLGSIIIAHVSFCFPFVALVVGARLAGFNREQEEAANDLGANDWQAFRDILVPHIKPALIAGALLAFTLSLDDFVITFFTSGPDTVTFPVKVYSMLRFSVTPEVNAASTMLILLTIVLMFLMMAMQSRARQRRKDEHRGPTAASGANATTPPSSPSSVSATFPSGGVKRSAWTMSASTSSQASFSPARPVGLRQDDLAAHARRSRMPTEGHIYIDGEDMARDAAEQPRREYGVPVLRGVSAYDGRR